MSVDRLGKAKNGHCNPETRPILFDSGLRIAALRRNSFFTRIRWIKALACIWLPLVLITQAIGIATLFVEWQALPIILLVFFLLCFFCALYWSMLKRAQPGALRIMLRRCYYQQWDWILSSLVIFNATLDVPLDSLAIRYLCNVTMRSKALELEVGLLQRREVKRNPSFRAKFGEIKALRLKIARLELDVPQNAANSFAKHAGLVRNLKEEIQRREHFLANEFPEQWADAHLKGVNWKSTINALPEHAVLLEFLQYKVHDWLAIFGRQFQEGRLERYLCFVIRRATVDFVDLGDANTIDELIKQHRDALGEHDTDSRLIDLDDQDCQNSRVANWRDTSVALSKRLFAPIERIVPRNSELVIAPDGGLSLLPFETLTASDGALLIDNYRVYYVSCGRDVARLHDQEKHSATPPVIIGDPDFDLSDGRAASSSEPNNIRSELDRAGLTFPRLPGTRVEAITIAALLGVSPLLDKHATKGSVRNVQSPEILHIASHGFFLQVADADAALREGNSTLERQRERLKERVAWLMSINNPMLRSGFALAGANSWFTDDLCRVDGEDGVLTAEEVTDLELSGTQLVVLSACNSGVGEIQRGEGVFGLRRAFVLAGARAVIMSLWKVSDDATRVLMELFYKNLQLGNSAPESLRRAQGEMRATHPHPGHWAAFICLGGLTSG